MTEERPQKLKILIVGDMSVGKTSLLTRFIDDTFSSSSLSTVGIDYKTKYVSQNNKKYELQIWDTAGQERFRGITKNYYKGSNGIVLVYDVTKRETFTNVKNWINSIKESLNFTEIGVVLCGNKCDCNEERQISREEGEVFARDHGVKFFETSCKENININETFLSIIDIYVLNGGKNKNDTNSKQLNKTKNNKNKKSCC